MKNRAMKRAKLGTKLKNRSLKTAFKVRSRLFWLPVFSSNPTTPTSNNGLWSNPMAFFVFIVKVPQ